ncbi:DNA polymerase I [Pseudomonas sp. C27(2019)]|uniref:DNA polymerase I n=1 Tax=Pseudomonas sp. C27(2019) TaxID=2604941 RepID=UPI001245CB19|nr:DNA polymerase I [Pseudomonas sp. C27(2019)]QEY57706.1 DNA polymerase I [Pseudomonas sp. C27(2019)]
MSQAPLVLVDGSSYLYRAFHALPPLMTSTGVPTGAVKGVLNMLRSLQKQYPDSVITVIFDAKGPTFRDELFAEYKAQRPRMPDDLRVQIEPLHECVKAMGFPFLCVEGVEADDVIGTLARSSTLAERDVVVSTGDKDMAQLVNGHVSLVNTMYNTKTDSAGVVEKFGIGPELIIDYLALMGDKSDNIPGVPGVGEKTALGLLVGLGDMDAIYDNIDKVASLPIRGAKTLGAKLLEHREMAYLSRKLATIKTDVELELDIEQMRMQEPQDEILMELYQRLEFKSWQDEIRRRSGAASNNANTVAPSSAADDLFATPVAPDAQSNADTEPTAAEAESQAQYHTILTDQAFADWLQRLSAAKLFAFDTETTSVDAQQARLVGISFAVAEGEAAYVPLAHSYMGVPEQLDKKKVLDALRPLLEDPAISKVCQNGKYDINVLARYEIAVQGVRFDTMLESYVLNSTATRHDMDSLALRYLNRSTIRFEDVAGKGAKQLTFDQVDLTIAGPYAAEDAEITLCLHNRLIKELQDIPPLLDVLDSIEIPLMPVLARIERCGALVDAHLLGQQSLELAEKLTELERQTFAIAGEAFNLASPKQLGVVLYEKLGLPILAKTAKGQPSTAEAVLSELAEQGHELPVLLMQYRSLSKLKSTYTDRLPEQINPLTGRIHTSYHQAVTATGRLSSSDPNLQNIPIRSAEGRRIRQAFIAPKGYKLLAADYSQIELRIMAHLAQDAGLLEAFRNDRDVHKATASEVFSVALDEVSSDQRRSAKAINFGLIYGMSAHGLAKQIGCDRGQAQMYMDRYFARYPGVLDYMERTRQQASEQGYVETLFGRRLYLPDIKAKNAAIRKGAERTAINAPMQGSAADIIKRAMIKVDEWLAETGLDARVIMQVHDELVLEVREDQVDALRDGLLPLMSAGATLDVPLIVEAGVGDNWDQAH